MSNTPAKEVKIILVTNHDHRFMDAADIRRKVFIEEQKVPANMEWDPHDGISAHLILYCLGKPAGTLRFYPDLNRQHIGRVAVLPQYRRRGFGRQLLERCLTEGRRLGFAYATLNAQSEKIGFYSAFGFHAIGEEFMEAGIPHRRMELNLDS